ncbi:MAG: hypothetical protein KDC53_15080 [Saprospiraceae bacterium]|nr:hypothetical protein [Saprospiraceae bacterium]
MKAYFLESFLFSLILVTLPEVKVLAMDYHVGPSQTLSDISSVPWASLQPGDRVFIHWRSSSYKEKWVINRQGNANNRIEIIGVNGPNGQQPVIDGNGATTAAGLNYWNENRGVIKIGGSNIPQDGLPSYITIENLDIRSARPPYTFTNDNGQTENYINNAASIYVEKGAHIVIRNCTITDSGNGIFIGAFEGQTQDILIEGNYIYGNGNVGSYYEHNTYTAAIDITYQYNRFGPLRSGAGGNNLKDRSAGLVVRYNWIRGGNRQLDLVDAEDTDVIVNNPGYHATHVYGNILIEPDGDGNSQILHYGGDSGNTSIYRKGDLYFYNNTILSERNGNTTLMRLSTNDETAHVFNNVIYTTASGDKLAMIDDHGTFRMQNNWLKANWVNCHGTPSGSVQNLGDNITGTDPLFTDLNNYNFKPLMSSPLINHGDPVPATLLPDYQLTSEYVKHQQGQTRTISGFPDIGAFEFMNSSCIDTTQFINGLWSNGIPDLTKHTIISGDYDSGIHGSLNTCNCVINPGVKLTIQAGDLLMVEHQLEVNGDLDIHNQGLLTVQQP